MRQVRRTESLNSCQIGLNRGDMVLILKHHIQGCKWTVGKIGSILCPSHTRSYDVLHRRSGKPNIPPVKAGWYTVSIEHPYAKGGFAFAALPEEHLAPHACTERCPVHLCRQATG